MAEKKSDAFIIRLPIQVAASLRKYLEDTTGMTISEALQLCAFAFYESSMSKGDASKDHKAEINDMLERRMLGAGKDALTSYRHIEGLQEYSKGAGRIEYLITIHPGDVVTVYDPNDPDYIGGSVTISKEAAIRLLLSKNGQLPDKLAAIMEDRQTDSVLSAIEQIIEDEYKMQIIQSNQPKYSMNHYGSPPKKSHQNGVSR